MTHSPAFDKIICVGKNYLEHARELGDAVPEKPVLFLKPPSAAVLIPGSGPASAAMPVPSIRLPWDRGAVHHECEIVVRLGRGGENLTIADAQAAISEVTLGLDLTLRDLQAQLKAKGHPWEISKVFAGSAVIGPWIPASDFKDYLDREFSFVVEGQVRQKGRGREMRMTPAECIAYASEFFPLAAGDVLFTGTPAGVGPLAPGQSAALHWEGRIDFPLCFV